MPTNKPFFLNLRPVKKVVTPKRPDVDPEGMQVWQRVLGTRDSDTVREIHCESKTEMSSDSLTALAMHDVQDNDQNSENQQEYEKERLSHFLLWCIAIQWRARCCGHNSTAWKTEGGALKVLPKPARSQLRNCHLSPQNENVRFVQSRNVRFSKGQEARGRGADRVERERAGAIEGVTRSRTETFGNATTRPVRGGLVSERYVGSPGRVESQPHE
jgi:hypothetical protein